MLHFIMLLSLPKPITATRRHGQVLQSSKPLLLLLLLLLLLPSPADPLAYLLLANVVVHHIHAGSMSASKCSRVMCKP